MASNDKSRSPDLELVRPDRNHGCSSSYDTAQTGSPAIQGEVTRRLQSKPDSARKMSFSSTETQPSVSGLQLCRSSPQRVDLTTALDCDSENRIPLPISLKGEDEVNDALDLNKTPHALDTEVCSGCCESATPQNKKADRVSPCSPCKLGEMSDSTKRSQQVIGDTYDTALELSDDEDQKEVAAWEPSSTCNLLKRKCLSIGSEILKNDSKFLYPSSSDQEAVEVRYADLSYLAPAEFLNDTVIDFYIKFIQLNLLKENDRLHRFHFFSSFFHKKLTSSRAQGKNWFEKVHKWTKGVNIFKKEYLFIPIHDNCHWSLAIVHFPVGQRVTLILHLDSLLAAAGHCSKVIFTVLKSYLMAERRHIKQQHGAFEEISNEPSKVICKKKPVPLQNNDWDCGLFTLYYIQKFVMEVDVKGFDNLFGRDWFDPIEASELREIILNILESFLTEKPTQS